MAGFLIALLILGEIATFIIPKVLTSQKTQRYNAFAKETIGIVSAAYQTALYSNNVTTSMSGADLA